MAARPVELQGASATTPSPLNGERAAVRGEGIRDLPSNNIEMHPDHLSPRFPIRRILARFSEASVRPGLHLSEERGVYAASASPFGQVRNGSSLSEPMSLKRRKRRAPIA